jgi:protein-tyrosine phosphatase
VTERPARRVFEFERLHSFRDVGGCATGDGRAAAWGWLYRSDSPATPRGEDWLRFLRLGIRGELFRD